MVNIKRERICCIKTKSSKPSVETRERARYEEWKRDKRLDSGRDTRINVKW